MNEEEFKELRSREQAIQLAADFYHSYKSEFDAEVKELALKMRDLYSVRDDVYGVYFTTEFQDWELEGDVLSLQFINRDSSWGDTAAHLEVPAWYLTASEASIKEREDKLTEESATRISAYEAFTKQRDLEQYKKIAEKYGL